MGPGVCYSLAGASFSPFVFHAHDRAGPNRETPLPLRVRAAWKSTKHGLSAVTVPAMKLINYSLGGYAVTLSIIILGFAIFGS